MLDRSNTVKSEIDRCSTTTRAAATRWPSNLRGSASAPPDRARRRSAASSGRPRGAGSRPSRAAPAAAPPPRQRRLHRRDEVRAGRRRARGGRGPRSEEEVTLEADESVVDRPDGDEEHRRGGRGGRRGRGGPETAEEASAPQSSSGSGRSIRGAEGARLIALNMALNGTPRDETARYLSQNFDLDDQERAPQTRSTPASATDARLTAANRRLSASSGFTGRARLHPCFLAMLGFRSSAEHQRADRQRGARQRQNPPSQAQPTAPDPQPQRERNAQTLTPRGPRAASPQPPTGSACAP